MNKTTKLICLLLGLLLSAGAPLWAKKKLLPGDYLLWVTATENGLRKDTVTNGFSFSLQYRPVEMVMLSNVADVSEINPQNFKAEQKDYASRQYYQLRITPVNETGVWGMSGKSNAAVFEQNISYFAFDMQQDVRLVQGSDTLTCVSFVHERLFRDAPYYTFLLAFDNPPKGKNADRIFVYNDRLLGTGTVVLRIPARAVRKTPVIKFK